MRYQTSISYMEKLQGSAMQISQSLRRDLLSSFQIPNSNHQVQLWLFFVKRTCKSCPLLILNWQMGSSFTKTPQTTTLAQKASVQILLPQPLCLQNNSWENLETKTHFLAQLYFCSLFVITGSLLGSSGAVHTSSLLLQDYILGCACRHLLPPFQAKSKRKKKGGPHIHTVHLFAKASLIPHLTL